MTKDAKPDTWMPLVIGDYLKDTTRLTTEQHGAYLLLIMSYWVSGPPPDRDSALASITRLPEKAWKKNREAIAEFFTVVDGKWRQKRIDAELDRWSAKKEKYAERAAAGGRAKAAKSTSQADFKQGKTPEKSCLKAAPQPASTVEEPIEGSSHSGGDHADARPEGASSRTPHLRVVGEPDPEIVCPEPAKPSKEERARLAAAVRAAVGVKPGGRR